MCVSLSRIVSVRPRLAAGVLVLSLLLSPIAPALGTQEVPKTIKIGVLAERGYERCLAKWTPTAEYLTGEIPGYSFTIVPLRFDEVCPAVERGEVDFVFANSSFYVAFERLYGASRIVTLKNLRLGWTSTVYAGVIFCKADREDIDNLDDLIGKTFMATKETSFGGWQTDWREMKEQGIDPWRDFADLRFGGTHDAVVHAVRDGKVDAGSVRTETLERMEQEGAIRLEEFRVIHKRGGGEADLPFVRSTRTYPEWPLAKTRHTSDKLAEQVTAALLKLSPDTPAARAASCAGWTVPRNYQPVHECLKELQISPYEDFGKIILGDVLKRYWHWIVSIVVLLAGMTITIVWVLRLLSERTRTEKKLRETHDFLENLVEHAKAPIIVWGPGSRITRFNRAFEHLTGYTADEVMGRELSVLFPELSKEESLDKIARAVGGEHWESVEIPIRRKNAETRFVLWNSANIYSEKGEVLLATIAQGVDITDRKQAEEERTALQEQLHQAQKMEAVGQLASGVAHDFNNLLTAIIGYLALAKTTLPQDHEAVKLLEGVEEAVEQAGGVTSSLLIFSRKTVTKKEPVELRELVEKSIRLLHRVLSSGIELVADTVGESPVWVRADSTQMQQVVMNLAINARDAMPDGGTLRISVSHATADDSEALTSAGFTGTQCQEPVAHLVVSDTGAGMSPEVRGRVFEPFFTTKPRGLGTGLGLSIIHSIVKDHGGHIEVQSGPGQGTTFTVVLPALGESATLETSKPTSATPRGHGELVLLAEDNPHVRNIITTLLESFDYEVLAAGDGASLMEHFERNRSRVRLLIIDIDLPKRSGIDCLHDIRADGARTPTIMITGGVDTNLENGFDENTLLLRKPFRMSELGAIAGRMLVAQHGQKENRA